MPTYAYRCADCGHALDIYQQFSDSALTQCPECDGRLRKVFGSLGVTFSGSGFYRTDSRSEGKGGGSAPASSGSGESSSADSSSSSAGGTSNAGSSPTPG